MKPERFPRTGKGEHLVSHADLVVVKPPGAALLGDMLVTPVNCTADVLDDTIYITPTKTDTGACGLAFQT